MQPLQSLSLHCAYAVSGRDKDDESEKKEKRQAMLDAKFEIEQGLNIDAENQSAKNRTAAQRRAKANEEIHGKKVVIYR